MNVPDEAGVSSLHSDIKRPPLPDSPPGIPKPLPRLQLVNQLHESAATWAQRARRNTQLIICYVNRSAEIMHTLDQFLRVNSPADFDYLLDFMAVSRLEEIMLTLHPTVVEEAECVGVNTQTCCSWEQNHRKIWAALRDLYNKPFRVAANSWEQDAENAAKFDEWVWITQIHKVIQTFPDQFEEARTLSQEIYGLEGTFWASDWSTRSIVIEAAIQSTEAVNRPFLGRKSYDGRNVTLALTKAVNLLRNSDPNTPSNHPSASSSAMAGTRPEPPVAKVPADIPGTQEPSNDIWRSLASYRIDQKSIALTKTVLGRGSSGIVLLGEMGWSIWKPRRSGTLVAVKILRTRGTLADNKLLTLALARELHIWFGLAHPHITPLVGFFLDGDGVDQTWLITPYMKNGNIRSYLNQHNPDQVVRLRMWREVAGGILYLHDRNLCHGDIKGANILVDDDGQAKLSDYGFTRLLEGETIQTNLAGTVRYMAPEFFSHKMPVRSKQSDVWAWSCLGLEVIFDKAPYGEVENDYAVVARILRGTPPLDVQSITVDEEIKELFKKCWVADPLERVDIKRCVKVVEHVLDTLRQHASEIEVEPILKADPGRTAETQPQE